MIHAQWSFDKRPAALRALATGSGVWTLTISRGTLDPSLVAGISLVHHAENTSGAVHQLGRNGSRQLVWRTLGSGTAVREHGR